MLKKTIETLLKNHKIYTAAQFGVGANTSAEMLEFFPHVSFYDVETDYSWKVIEELNCKYCTKMFLEDPFEDLKYLDNTYDFAYVHNRFDADTRRSILNYLYKKDTKFILAHPTVLKTNPSGYQVLSLNTEEGEYRLYYLDLVFSNKDNFLESN